MQTQKATRLQEAIREHDIEKFRRLIQQGENILQIDHMGRTLLHEACGEGSVDVLTKRVVTPTSTGGKKTTETYSRGEGPIYIQQNRAIVDMIGILLKNGLDVNAKDKEGNTPLHIACRKRFDDPEVIKMRVSVLESLICNGTDVNAKGVQDQTPLHLACNLNLGPSIKNKVMVVSLVETLISNGAYVNEKDAKGRTALHIVCSTGHNDTVIRMQIIEQLIKRGADKNEKDKKGRTILHYASEKFKRYMDDHEWTELVGSLIDIGADANIADRKGITLLHLNPGMRIAEKMLACGADINAKNKKGETPLISIACSIGLSELKFFIENGADLSNSSVDGESVLHQASKSCDERLEKIVLLLDSGLDPNVTDKKGRRPLHLVVEDPPVVKLLLSRGADPNVKDNNGRTPLHEAVQVQKTITYLPSKDNSSPSKKFPTDGTLSLEILLDHIEDVNCKTLEGWTALHEAAKSTVGIADETLQRINLLLSKGADPNSRDHKNRLPIYYAAYANKSEVVNKLKLVTNNPDFDIYQGKADKERWLEEKRKKPLQHLGRPPISSSEDESLEDIKEKIKVVALPPNPPPPPPPPPNPNT